MRVADLETAVEGEIQRTRESNDWLRRELAGAVHEVESLVRPDASSAFDGGASRAGSPGAAHAALQASGDAGPPPAVAPSPVHPYGGGHAAPAQRGPSPPARAALAERENGRSLFPVSTGAAAGYPQAAATTPPPPQRSPRRRRATSSSGSTQSSSLARGTVPVSKPRRSASREVSAVPYDVHSVSRSPSSVPSRRGATKGTPNRKPVGMVLGPGGDAAGVVGVHLARRGGGGGGGEIDGVEVGDELEVSPAWGVRGGAARPGVDVVWHTHEEYPDGVYATDFDVRGRRLSQMGLVVTVPPACGGRFLSVTLTVRKGGGGEAADAWATVVHVLPTRVRHCIPVVRTLQLVLTSAPSADEEAGGGVQVLCERVFSADEDSYSPTAAAAGVVPPLATVMVGEYLSLRYVTERVRVRSAGGRGSLRRPRRRGAGRSGSGGSSSSTARMAGSFDDRHLVTTAESHDEFGGEDEDEELVGGGEGSAYQYLEVEEGPPTVIWYAGSVEVQRNTLDYRARPSDEGKALSLEVCLSTPDGRASPQRCTLGGGGAVVLPPRPVLTKISIQGEPAVGARLEAVVEGRLLHLCQPPLSFVWATPSKTFLNRTSIEVSPHDEGLQYVLSLTPPHTLRSLGYEGTCTTIKTDTIRGKLTMVGDPYVGCTLHAVGGDSDACRVMWYRVTEKGSKKLLVSTDSAYTPSVGDIGCTLEVVCRRAVHRSSTGSLDEEFLGEGAVTPFPEEVAASGVVAYPPVPISVDPIICGDSHHGCVLVCVVEPLPTESPIEIVWRRRVVKSSQQAPTGFGRQASSHRHRGRGAGGSQHGSDCEEGDTIYTGDKLLLLDQDVGGEIYVEVHTTGGEHRPPGPVRAASANTLVTRKPVGAINPLFDREKSGILPTLSSKQGPCGASADALLSLHNPTWQVSDDGCLTWEPSASPVTTEDPQKFVPNADVLLNTMRLVEPVPHSPGFQRKGAAVVVAAGQPASEEPHNAPKGCLVCKAPDDEMREIGRYTFRLSQEDIEWAHAQVREGVCGFYVHHSNEGAAHLVITSCGCKLYVTDTRERVPFFKVRWSADYTICCVGEVGCVLTISQGAKQNLTFPNAALRDRAVVAFRVFLGIGHCNSGIIPDRLSRYWRRGATHGKNAEPKAQRALEGFLSQSKVPRPSPSFSYVGNALSAVFLA